MAEIRSTGRSVENKGLGGRCQQRKTNERDGEESNAEEQRRARCFVITTSEIRCVTGSANNTGTNTTAGYYGSDERHNKEHLNTKTHFQQSVFKERGKSWQKKRRSPAELFCVSAKTDFISHRQIPPLWQHVGGLCQSFVQRGREDWSGWTSGGLGTL